VTRLDRYHKADRGYQVQFLQDGKPVPALHRLFGTPEMSAADCLLDGVRVMRNAGVVAREFTLHVGPGVRDGIPGEVDALPLVDGRLRGMEVREISPRGDWLVVEAIS
jgi:hypothetical protein